MKVQVLKEAGFEEALLGLSLSYNSEPSERVADNLAHKQGGHNKFLESVMVWLDITAPRYWWAQADTYRVGITKQSESTMHTILRRHLTDEDFEGGCHPGILQLLNEAIEAGSFDWIKHHLPESFLQRRIVCTNYKTLQNMEAQRRTHRLKEWQFFLDAIKSQLSKSEWISE